MRINNLLRGAAILSSSLCVYACSNNSVNQKCQSNTENMEEDQVRALVNEWSAEDGLYEDLKDILVATFVAKADEFENEEMLKEAYDLCISDWMSDKEKPRESKKLTPEEKEEKKAAKEKMRKQKEDEKARKEQLKQVYLEKCKTLYEQLFQISKAKKDIESKLTSIRQIARANKISLPSAKKFLEEISEEAPDMVMGIEASVGPKSLTDVD